jgi:hypothetical protein
MNAELAKVLVKGDRVTLKFQWRGYRDRIVQRQQITLDRRQFESAFSTSTVEIPWTGLL